MATCRVEWKTSALKELKRIDRTEIPRVVSAIQALVLDPRPVGVRKLQGSDRSHRIRVGDYRVIYEIVDSDLVVQIVRVRHRKDVYRD